MRRTLSLVLVLLSVSAVTVSATTAAAQTPADGLTLITLNGSSESFLIELAGNVVRSYVGSSAAGHTAYLLPDDSVLRTTRDPNGQFAFGGAAGRLQIIDVDNTIVWDYFFSTFEHQLHHDVARMPNGNILAIAWERKTKAQAEALGRVTLDGPEIWPTLIVEIQPNGVDGGNIVWEWHLWDHMVQESDPAKPNYGLIADHPELVDINLGTASNGSWDHANSIDYNPTRDEIVLSCHRLSEVMVIDHSTTTQEAAGHSGGDRGRGGDILYRWGNPANYGRPGDRQLFGVHGANWIDAGRPGAGNILLYSNGNRGSSDLEYSSVLELAAPVDGGGGYELDPGQAYGPADPTWSYADPPSLFSPRFGSGDRLPNGNTLISEGVGGYLFEVSSAGDVLWEYFAANDVFAARRYLEDDIVPVLVQSAEARWERDHVRVRWLLVTEVAERDITLRRAVGESRVFEPIPGLEISTTGRETVALDRSVIPGERYLYQVEIADSQGGSTVFERRVEIPAARFVLGSIHPNPFNPRARVEFELSRGAHARLQVVDARGRHVATLVDETLGAGPHARHWSGTDEQGRAVASGSYSFVLQVEGRRATQRAVLLK